MAVKLMDVFVVVSIATVYQNNGTATEAPVNVIDPLRCSLLYCGPLCLYKQSVENHTLQNFLPSQKNSL